MPSTSRRLLSLGLAIGATLMAGTVPAAWAAPKAAVDVRYDTFRLPNGLTVIVHEDHQAPVVAVAVWYGVGSSYEPEGKTGFAHLFEHLMFSGSENHKAGYFVPFERIGTTDMNGMTEFDHTEYFETVPATALDMALWMESDRMGHLLGAIGQNELNAQRGVVENEKRQRANGPYGRMQENLLLNAFPANHPYHHDAIGSMTDLEAASLDDVKGWFRGYYGAANSTLVLAGDITLAEAKAKALQYFGDIPSGPPVARPRPWIAPRGISTRAVQQDHIESPLIVREWNVPQRGDPDNALLALTATILGDGRTSRLEQRLVDRDQLADSVSVNLESHALASMFEVQVFVRHGVDPARVEAAIADEWAKFLKDGPTGDELELARGARRSSFLHRLDSTGRTADALASSQVELGSPSAYKTEFARMDAATPASVLAAARQWLSKGDYTLTIVPAKPGADLAAEDRAVAGLPAAPGRPAPITPAPKTYAVTPSTVDRAKGVPDVTAFPDLRFPAVERGRLKNGIEVVLARRPGMAVTEIGLQLDAGNAADQGRKPGTETFVSHMLDEGTATLPSIEIARREQRLGAEITPSSDRDATVIHLRAVNAQLEPSLALFADIVRNPAFRAADVERLRQNGLSQIAFEKAQPNLLASRVLPPLIYGSDHPYGEAASGTVDSFTKITRDDLVAFHRDFYRPDNARIFVVGDTDLAAITTQLDKAFGDWAAPAAPLPHKTLFDVPQRAGPRVFLIDRKGAEQSVIEAGSLTTPTGAPGYLSTKLANDLFGDAFTSRLNLNLREDKHWSYGAYSAIGDAVGQRPLTITAAVQTDKTAASMTEIQKELGKIIADAPPTAAEVDRVKANRERVLPGAYEQASAVLGALETNQEYHRPDDYQATLRQVLDAQSQEDVAKAAKQLFVPGALTWVVIGDLSKIEQGVRALNIGPVTVLDEDGKIVR